MKDSRDNDPILTNRSIDRVIRHRGDLEFTGAFDAAWLARFGKELEHLQSIQDVFDGAIGDGRIG